MCIYVLSICHWCTAAARNPDRSHDCSRRQRTSRPRRCERPDGMVECLLQNTYTYNSNVRLSLSFNLLVTVFCVVPVSALKYVPHMRSSHVIDAGTLSATLAQPISSQSVEQVLTPPWVAPPTTAPIAVAAFPDMVNDCVRLLTAIEQLL